MHKAKLISILANAQANSPDLKRWKVSSEKVENVLKPPQKPIAKRAYPAVFSGRVALQPAATNQANRAVAKTLLANVPKGN